MKVFLTGAAGFVGAATLQALLADGHEVAAPVRPGSTAARLVALEGSYRRIEVDLRDGDGVAAAVTDFLPECVIHLAWWGVANSARFERRQIAENLDAACAIVEAAGACGATSFVGIGSQGEYGRIESMREDALPQPTTLYGASKLAALFLTRQLAAQTGMRHAWGRIFSTYGPGDNEGWLIPTLIGTMLAGQRPQVTLGTQYWDWLYVEDVARAIVALATTPSAEGIFNIGSGQPVTVRSMVEAVRDLAAPGMELAFGEIPFRPDQVMHMKADITRLTSITGWRPQVTMDEGLSRTVAWMRERR